MAEIRSGATISGYRIERKLGAGAMGTVYLAEHPRLPRRDALKVLAAERGANPEFRARFIREAELAGRLDHPNIVPIYDYGADGETLWIAMRFVSGYDAATLLARWPHGLPPERAVGIVAAAAAGLDQAHRAGLLHRDVKPANIMIEPGGGGRDRALITDFGIARTAAELDPVATTGGSVAATLAYAAPEQIRGEWIDQRVDVYGLGCTLYQLLTGTVPFPRDSAGAMMHAQLTAPPPRPSRAGRGVPGVLDAVIARAMAKNPGERYGSCGELAAASIAALQSKPPGLIRRHAGRVALSVAAVAVLAAAGIAGVVTTRHQDRAMPAPTATSATNTPAAVDDSKWEAYQFIVDAFPGLLPRTPNSTGYQGLKCHSSDEHANAVPVTKVLTPLSYIGCSGDQNPVVVVSLRCNTDRSPVPAADRADLADDPDSRSFSRASGTGFIAWRDEKQPDRTQVGRLEIRFDGAARGFCKMGIWGGASGKELFDTWWPNAPL
ncbi:serine/threonine-protein kinase [Nocardia vaccinii]|uniref:serine/threonine-protein kinase n=1 Tax=Nocardia vaccinii TaxID=1822 RepID=UPI00082C0CB7|nr:serine/threonine-protein kinase [Nocardia vaccinii]